MPAKQKGPQLIVRSSGKLHAEFKSECAKLVNRLAHRKPACKASMENLMTGLLCIYLETRPPERRDDLALAALKAVGRWTDVATEGEEGASGSSGSPRKHLKAGSAASVISGQGKLNSSHGAVPAKRAPSSVS